MRVLEVGSKTIAISGNPHGTTTIHVPDLPDPAYVQLTARVTDGGMPPNGHGPLYVPFYHRQGCDIVIHAYDIMAAANSANVVIDYVIYAP